MARITKGQSQAVLETLAALYMHIDNTKRANDCILRKIDEISNHFIVAKLRHTSSDVQKQIVDGDSLNANMSYKYPGLKRALSSYTFLDNRFGHFYATVISSAEREACYVLDGIMHMDSENTRDEFGLADPKIIALIHTRFWEGQLAA